MIQVAMYGGSNRVLGNINTVLLSALLDSMTIKVIGVTGNEREHVVDKLCAYICNRYDSDILIFLHKTSEGTLTSINFNSLSECTTQTVPLELN